MAYNEKRKAQPKLERNPYAFRKPYEYQDASDLQDITEQCDCAEQDPGLDPDPDAGDECLLDVYFVCGTVAQNKTGPLPPDTKVYLYASESNPDTIFVPSIGLSGGCFSKSGATEKCGLNQGPILSAGEFEIVEPESEEIPPCEGLPCSIGGCAWIKYEACATDPGAFGQVLSVKNSDCYAGSNGFTYIIYKDHAYKRASLYCYSEPIEGSTVVEGPDCGCLFRIQNCLEGIEKVMRAMQNRHYCGMGTYFDWPDHLFDSCGASISTPSVNYPGNFSYANDIHYYNLSNGTGKYEAILVNKIRDALSAALASGVFVNGDIEGHSEIIYWDAATLPLPGVANSGNWSLILSQLRTAIGKLTRIEVATNFLSRSSKEGTGEIAGGLPVVTVTPLQSQIFPFESGTFRFARTGVTTEELVVYFRSDSEEEGMGTFSGVTRYPPDMQLFSVTIPAGSSTVDADSTATWVDCTFSPSINVVIQSDPAYELGSPYGANILIKSRADFPDQIRVTNYVGVPPPYGPGTFAWLSNCSEGQSDFDGIFTKISETTGSVRYYAPYFCNNGKQMEAVIYVELYDPYPNCWYTEIYVGFVLGGSPGNNIIKILTGPTSGVLGTYTADGMSWNIEEYTPP